MDDVARSPERFRRMEASVHTMCNLYASQEPETYAQETRAIRLNGHCTSVRLETAFWDILEEIAEEEGTTVARFASTLYGEVVERRGAVGNFASLLRVACTVWLRERNGARRREAPREAAIA